MPGPIPKTMQQRREAVASTTGATPLSYNSETHEVVATLSKGSPVQRMYGRESLEISSKAIDLSRLKQGGVPLLDHHSQAGIDQVLGKVTDAWISGGALMGRLKFAGTKRGKVAEGMVSRGEIGALSIGYAVNEWQVTDGDGNVIDPEHDRIPWDEDDLNFLAKRWMLFEASLVGVPADGASMIRSLGGRNELADIKARMQARQTMTERQSLRGDALENIHARMAMRVRMVCRMARDK